MTEPQSREERIAAFLDGALDDAQQAAFEAEMERDPELAAEVQRMMGNDALLREAFAAPIDQGIDAALLARMGLAQAPQSAGIDLAERRAGAFAAANDNPPIWARIRAPDWRRWRVPLGGAIAAALALTLIVTTQQGRAPGTGFDHALDGTPSGQVVALAGGRTLQPLLTFQAGDGRYCREFSIGSGQAGGTGIACRSGGRWQVEALDQGATRLANGTGIVLAAGQDGIGLDAAYQRLGAGDPMGSDREKALISNGWKPVAK